ncbi:MAG: TetR/AcrR family transcriptional regulator [Ilumatobacteraceae bacterium]
MAQKDEPDVELRVAPQQARARQAIDAVLEATGQLLDEVGYDRVTTKAVAARAGVNIATLYRYFPDKISLARALAARYDHQYGTRLAALLEQVATREDWRSAVRELIDETIRVRRLQPGMEGLRRATPPSDELQQLQDEVLGGIHRDVAAAIVHRRPDMAPKDAKVIAIALTTAVDAVLALRFGRLSAKQVAAHATDIAVGYLAPVFDAGNITPR